MYFFQHDIDENDIEAVAQSMRDGHITTGAKLKEFSAALCDRFGFHRVELCSSGTSALHLTLHALGIGPGDEVITTPFVGVWTSNPILMVGATPVYADIDRKTYNLDPDSVAGMVTPRTKAVLPVSVNGVPVDHVKMRSRLMPGIRIIYDDIEALGSRRDGLYVGADVGNDISVGGFWVSKQVTTACGGMVTSQDDDFLTKFEKLTRHGHGLVGDMWEQHFGFNAWMPDPLAALGISQLARLDEKQERLLRVKRKMDRLMPGRRRQMVPDGYHATEFIYLVELSYCRDKKKYSDRMAQRGIPTRPYFNSLTEVPHLKQYAMPGATPVNDLVSKRTMALPYHWKLTDRDIEIIANAHYQCDVL